MAKTQAWERANDPAYLRNLDTEQYQELMLEAGYSAEVVREATLGHGWRRLDTNQDI